MKRSTLVIAAASIVLMSLATVASAHTFTAGGAKVQSYGAGIVVIDKSHAKPRFTGNAYHTQGYEDVRGD